MIDAYTAKEQQTSMTPEYSIGLLAADFTDKYELEVMKGVLKKAREANVNVVTFIGGSIHADHIECSTNFFQAWKNSVFDIVSKESIDGLLSITDVICTYANTKQKIEFYNKFGDLPIVLVGAEMDGHSSVSVDELSGIQHVVDHLIDVHACKSIAFIGNMDEIPYYHKRFQAYKRTLLQRNIPFSDRLVKRGGFSKEEIYSSVKDLIKSGVLFDALVCVDDFMASHAMTCLSENGLFIPSDVIVTGFDDIAESRFFSPALTTVRQPLQEIGYNAAELLIKQIQAEANDVDIHVENIVLSSELVIRRSCGCFYHRVKEKPVPAPISTGDNEVISQLIDFFKSQNEAISNDSIFRVWAEQLYAPFKEGLHENTEIEFYKLITDLSKNVHDEGFDILDFKRIVAPFISLLTRKFEHQSDFFFFDKLRGNTMEIIDEISVGISIKERMKQENQAFALFSVSQRFISSCDDLAKLDDVIKADFPGLGIDGFSLALYLDKKNTSIVEQKIRMGIESRFKTTTGHSFPRERVLPEGVRSIKKRCDLVVLPLHFNNEQLGFAVFELGNLDGLLYETLANLLSSTIKELELIGKVQQHASHLKEVVANRTKDIMEVNNQLRLEIERKEGIKQALQKEKDLAQITLNSIGDCVITTDYDFRIRYLNPAAEELTEYVQQDAEGRSIKELFPIDDSIGNHIFNEPVEMQISTLSNRIVDISLFAAFIPGERKGIIFVARDISKRKQIERQAEEQLEQLIQAGKMASLGILVSGVAHEINNPNNFIMLNAPVLKEIFDSLIPELLKIEQFSDDRLFGGIEWEDLRKQIPFLIEGIINGAYRINTIVKELKNYAQPVDMEKEQNIQINDIINSSLVLLSAIIEKSTDRFELSLGDSMPVISCNRQKIEQVIINLVSNACQALSDTSQSLRIATFYDAEYVILEVMDEGVGIRPGDLEHISDPFFTTKRESGGLGLGLSLSSKIVKDHKGTLVFKSEPGQGTTVTLKLPIQKSKKVDMNA